jgi:hypothetical protein
MPNVRGRLLGLCVPPILLSGLDGALTLTGQSSAYWAGDRAQVNELSPTFHWLLTVHPLAFVAGWVVWVLVFVGLILLLPKMLALTASLAVTTAHEWGASSWLAMRFDYGYQLIVAMYIVGALVMAVGIRQTMKMEGGASERAGRKMPVVARWGMICLLFGVVVYLFLWPRQP